MFFIRAASVLAALGWSIYKKNFVKFANLVKNFRIEYLTCVYAANTFLGESQPYGKKALAHYPICLFYAVIAWIVITHYPH